MYDLGTTLTTEQTSVRAQAAGGGKQKNKGLTARAVLGNKLMQDVYDDLVSKVKHPLLHCAP